MDHTVDLSSKGARRRRIPMRVRFRAFRRHWASGFVFVVVFRIVLAIWPERPDWNPTREEIAISSLRMVVSSEIACRE